MDLESVFCNKSDGTQHCVIISYCRVMDLLYGSLLVFDSIRTGFPNVRVTVIDNGSIPEARGPIAAAARACDAGFVQVERPRYHSALLEEVLHREQGSLVICDPDIVFWQSMEPIEIGGLIAGRLIPKFADPYSKTITMPRLHTSLLMIPSAPRLQQRISDIRQTWWDFRPWLPYTVKMDDWYRWDTGAALLSALDESEIHVFGDKELNSYDHLFCGSHLDWVTQRFPEPFCSRFVQAHEAARTDVGRLRGLWVDQQQFFESLATD